MWYLCELEASLFYMAELRPARGGHTQRDPISINKVKSDSERRQTSASKHHIGTPTHTPLRELRSQ